jgi:glucose-6-phosphate 1-dehydrogenase
LLHSTNDHCVSLGAANQVLCMVAMEKPVSLRASDLRDEKVCEIQLI